MLLYIHTVLVTVFRMRERGQRRSSSIRSDPGTRGWLHFDRVPLDDYGPRMEARLLTEHGGADLILPLQYAAIRRVSGVMHIVGKEYFSRSTKGKVEVWRQSWMCATDLEHAHQLLDRVENRGLAAIFPDYEDDDQGNPP